MNTMNSLLTEKARACLNGVALSLERQTPREIAARVDRIVDDHHLWRRTQCINLNCAENVMSPLSSRLLGCDMALRSGEGFPGDRPHPPGQQTKHLDEIEAIIVALAKRMFRVDHVEWRPMSSTMANTAVFMSLLERGDLIFSQAEDGGGNYSYHEVAGAGVAGLRVRNIPFTGEAFEIDLDRTRDMMRRERPRMIVIGGSNILFPYPVRELAEIAREIDARILYDAAHVSVFIAAGLFQDPIAEGADLVTLSTHKVMAGPVGGMVLTNDEAAAYKVHTILHPTFMQTRGGAVYPSLAFRLAELIEHGEAYALQLNRNAKALAAALEAEGFRLIARDRGYTETQQVYVSFGSVERAKEAQDRAQSANILLAANYLAGDMSRGGRTGGRMSVQELTRQGLREAEMAEVARFMRRVILDRAPPEAVAREIEAFLEPFHAIRFCFEPDWRA